MNTRVRLLISFCLMAPGLVMGQVETKVAVSGERVNLRAKAEKESEVVGQVSEGDELRAKSFQDDWVEVAPPDKIDLWIHKDFVQDGAISGNRLYVRAGPGINYSTVGMLNKGDRVKIRGEMGEWIRIAAPPQCSLWVNRSLVSVIQPQKTAPVPVAKLPPPAVAQKVVQVPVLPPKAAGQAYPSKPSSPTAVTVPLPEDLALIPLEGQGRLVQRDGVLKYVGFIIGRPSRYRLAKVVGKRVEGTVCYVRGNSAQLESFLNKRLLIRGREYWVQGAKYPVVIPEQIIPKAEE